MVSQPSPRAKLLLAVAGSNDQVGEYVRLAWDLNKTISVGEIETRLLKIGGDDREHSIDWAVETITNTNCYEGWEEELRYLMYCYEEANSHKTLTNEQWLQIWEESASHSIEHIQAQETGRHSSTG